MSKHWLILTVGLILLLLTMPLLAACSDDDDGEITGVTTTQVTATTAPASSLTIDSSIGEILDDGEALLRKCLGDEIVDNPQMSMAFGMSLPTIAPMSGGVITDEMLACVSEGLGGTSMTTAQPTETKEPTKTTQPTKTISGCTKEAIFKWGTTGTVVGMSAEARDPSQEIAMDEINARGGIKIGDTCVNFKYYFEDDKGTSGGAVSAISKLLYDDKVQLVFHTGSVGTQGTVWQPYTEEEKVIAFGNDIYEAWLGPDKPYSFAIRYATEIQPLIVLDWVSKNRPDIKKVQAVRPVSANNEIIAEVAEKVAFPEYGIEYAGTSWAEYATRDFYPILTSALQSNPDALLVEFYFIAPVVKQARELGFEGEFLVLGTIPDYAFNMMAPEDIEGMVSLNPSPDSPLVPQYYWDYRETYKEKQGAYPFSIITFPAYLTPYYIAAVIKATGSTDTEKLIEAMATQTFTLEFPDGGTMDIKMGGDQVWGLNRVYSPPQYVSVIESGKPRVVEEITAEETNQYIATFMRYR